jgi:pyruvate formate lyase activating enzyme
MEGRLHSVETLGTLDGPGLRTVIFMQGCPLRCEYCHNPDTWHIDGGTITSAESLTERILRYVPYYGKNGGVTASGGEPLVQQEFLIELFEKLKSYNIHTVIDTSGCLFNENTSKLLELTDLVLLDIKNYSKNRFTDYCGEVSKQLWIRQVIIPDINDSEENIYQLYDFIKTLNVQKVQLLPYHSMGRGKWKLLGLSYPLKDVPDMDKDKCKKLQELLGSLLSGQS